MKKYIIPFVFLLGMSSVAAQPTEYDAINMVQTDIQGTARYMSMAGAFGALGGDPSSIKDNPAGLGVYRSSELSTTFNILSQSSKASWDGERGNDDLFKFGFNNFTYVFSLPTYAAQTGSTSGLLQSNFSFGYNKLKNFNRRSTMQGGPMSASLMDYATNLANSVAITIDEMEDFDYDMDFMPWLPVLAYDTWLIESTGDGTWAPILFPGETVLPRYSIHERGYMDEYSFSWAGNFSNTFFLGAGINIRTLSYHKSSFYSEDFGAKDYMELDNDLKTTGSGFNMNFGIIYKPINPLRIGISYRTPTIFTGMTDTSCGDMRSGIDYTDGFRTYSAGTEYAKTYYEMRMPGQWTGSLAYLIGTKALISTDVQYIDYRNTRLMGEDGDRNLYDAENNGMENIVKGGITAKFGAEYRVTPNFSIRAGIAAETGIHNTDSHKLVRDNTKRTDMEYFHHRGTSYFTAGLGYRGNYWYFDAAFVNKNTNQDFYPFNMAGAGPASVTVRDYNVVATIGVKF